MATLHTFQSIFFSRLDLSQQSKITQQVGMTVLAGHVLKNGTRYRIIATAIQNVKKSSVDLNEPPQRLQVCNFFIFTAAKK